MNEDEIVARARQEVATRRTMDIKHKWNRNWRWVPFSLMLAIVFVNFAIPMALSRKLFWFMGGICSLRPSHSYFAGDLQFPLESRMMGIYSGFLLTFVLLCLAGRTRARRLGGTWVLGILVIMFASMVFDGVNSTLAEIGLQHLYAPTNMLRLVTGLLSGIAFAPVLVWLFGAVTLPDNKVPQRVVRSLSEFLVPLVVAAGFAALIILGDSWSYYPVAFISVGGVVMLLTGVFLLVILTASGYEKKARRRNDLIVPGSVALLVTFAILVASAMLRWSVEGNMF